MNNQEFHPSQWAGFYSAYWGAQISSWALLLVALSAIGFGAGSRESWKKAIAFGTTIGCCAVATSQRKTVRRLAGHIRDIEDLSDAGFQNFAASVLNSITATFQQEPAVDLGEAEIEELPPVPYYDLSLTRQNNHTIVTGPTGAGKSELVKWLIRSYFDGANVQVYDSDCEPGDWPGMPVFGRGGDFIGISGAMVEDLELLQERCELRGMGKAIGGEEVRVCEEFPAVSAELSDLVGGKSSSAAHWLKRIARRGRKYRIKLILVTQETSVAAMGIEGEGGVRRAFTILYLGSAAIEAAEKLKDKALSKAFLQHFQTMERPCLVDHKGRFFLSEIPVVQPVQLPVQVVSEPVQPEPETETVQPVSEVVQTLNRILEASPVESEPVEPAEPESSENLKKRISELQSTGLNQKQIIFVLWGVKAGGSNAYKEAVNRYKKLIGET